MKCEEASFQHDFDLLPIVKRLEKPLSCRVSNVESRISLVFDRLNLLAYLEPEVEHEAV